MKPYLVFSGENSYPSGGWEDYQGSCDSLEEAKEKVLHCLGADWGHVVHKEAIVLRGERYGVAGKWTWEVPE